MYSLSSHPVWVALSKWCNGLPDEIINIIYSYGTFYSPIYYTFNEFRRCIDYNKKVSKNNSIRIDDIVKTIKFNLVSSSNIYRFHSVCNSFFTRYCINYTKETDYLVKIFIEYCVNSDINPSILNNLNKLLKINSKHTDSFLLNNIKTIIGCSLKNGLALSFYKKIYGIHISDIDFEEEQELCYDYQTNKFNLNLLWKNIIYVLKYKHIASKADLLMFNFLCGIKYGKRWTRLQLRTNLYKIENMDYNIIIEQLDKWPYIYSISELYDAMNSNPPLPFVKIMDMVKL